MNSLADELLCCIAVHIEPDTKSIINFRISSKRAHKTIFKFPVYKPVSCRIKDIPLFQRHGAVLLHIKTSDQFTMDRHEIVNGVTYQMVKTVHVDRLLLPMWLKNVFYVFPNVKNIVISHSVLFDCQGVEGFNTRHETIIKLATIIGASTIKVSYVNSQGNLTRYVLWHRYKGYINDLLLSHNYILKLMFTGLGEK